MRIVYFTSGEIGAGHWAHAAALERAFTRRGIRADLVLLTNRPPVRFEERGLRLELVDFDAKLLRDPAEARQSQLFRRFEELAPDLVLVDLAYLPIQRVREAIHSEIWLLSRWMPTQYYGGPLNRAFRPEVFARRLSTEPIARFPGFESIEPLVCVNREECYTREEVRRELAIDGDGPLHLVLQAGLPGELEQLLDAMPASAREGAHVVALSPHTGRALFPAARYFLGVDGIWGGAGYNLYWECRWLGVDRKARLTPFPRTIDDQTPRVWGAEGYVMRENGADRLASLIFG